MANKKVSLFISVAYLIKNIVFSPVKVFINIKKGENVIEVFVVFCSAAFLSFLKSYLEKPSLVANTYFRDERIVQLLKFLTIPQVSWVLTYISYFLFLACVFGICRLFDREIKMKPFLLSLMSISALGVTMQIIFYFLQLILAKHFIFVGFYLVFCWAIVLSFFAIKTTQNISLAKCIICFLIPAFLFAIFTVGLPAIAPYLAFLY